MSIKATEDALLEEVRRVVGAHVRTVESLPADWDDALLTRLLRQVPGAFVAWAGGQAARDSGAQLALAARWLVFVCTGHASGEAARRRGDSMQPGAYELLAALAPQLHGFEVPDVGTCYVEAMSNLYSDSAAGKGVAVYSIELALDMPFPRPLPGTEVLGEFDTFTAQYDIPAHAAPGEHEKWLSGEPTDTAPDAQDRVVLP